MTDHPVHPPLAPPPSGPPVTGSLFKVKLASGRILGPIDLNRISQLILKNQITGGEQVREYPQGTWRNINQIPAISVLLVGQLQRLGGETHAPARPPQLELPVDPFRSTVLLPQVPQATAGARAAPPASQPAAPSFLPLEGTFKAGSGSLQSLELLGVTAAPAETSVSAAESAGDLPRQPTEALSRLAQGEEVEKPKGRHDQGQKPDKKSKKREPSPEASALPPGPKEDPTWVDHSHEMLASEIAVVQAVELLHPPRRWVASLRPRRQAAAATVMFKRSATWRASQGGSSARKVLVRGLLILGLAVLLGPRVLQWGGSNQPLAPAVRPQLPEVLPEKSDPKKSEDIYLHQALGPYLEDTVSGYRTASEQFRAAASADSNNVKALAMLASSYLNLIDASNKDENYFSVISQLIDLSRNKLLDLPETVIADVEFFLVVGKAEAAENRIVQYTQSHPNYGLEMLYYLALCFFERGDARRAANFLNSFPDNRVFSSKIFYLRGQVAEQLHDDTAALAQYAKALQFSPKHAKSHLRIAALLNKKGQIKESAASLQLLITHVDLLAGKDLSLAYFLQAQVLELEHQWDQALGFVEKAVRLAPTQSDYLLELFTLRARAGDSLEATRKPAKMYYFLGEGERLVQVGRYQEALIPFLQARQMDDRSALPLVKMGDMFSQLENIENARLNYRLAHERAPGDVSVASKYIKTLIQSYEWEEAAKLINQLRALPVTQSTIDKAAADMYQKQGQVAAAQTFYRKAMSWEVIDPAVYMDYAKSLMVSKNFKDAPFFFALSLRFDPLNREAKILTAKCVAETESIDRAISMLQDELERSSTVRAEFLTAMAELQMQKGRWDLAQQNVTAAMAVNPNYSVLWKVQAQIYMNQEGSDKEALNKALKAYQSFAERNSSDLSGYLERYRIFIKQTQFEKASGELDKIYQLYPKYPNLHYYHGALFAIEGNHKAAVGELTQELTNNPNVTRTMMALGKEYLELKAPQMALELFSRVMQQEPNNADAKQSAGWANYQLRNFPAAIALLQAAVGMDQANPLLYRRLGIVQRDVGDSQAACEAFRNYLAMEPDAADKEEFRSCF